MKDEVPPALVDAHVKSIDEALKEGKKVDASYNLEKTGIAGTGADKDEFEKGMSVIYIRLGCVFCYKFILTLRTVAFIKYNLFVFSKLECSNVFIFNYQCL